MPRKEATLMVPPREGTRVKGQIEEVPLEQHIFKTKTFRELACGLSIPSNNGWKLGMKRAGSHASESAKTRSSKTGGGESPPPNGRLTCS